MTRFVLNGDAVVISMAGLAEAAFAFVMLIMLVGLVVFWILGIVSIVVRSWLLWAITCAMLICFSLFFQPWQAFAPFDPASAEDPDVISLVHDLRFIGICWFVTIGFLLFSGGCLWVNQRSASETNPKKPIPTLRRVRCEPVNFCWAW